MCSRRMCSLALAVALGSAGRARGEEIRVNERLSVTLSNGQQVLEAGLEQLFGDLKKVTDPIDHDNSGSTSSDDTLQPGSGSRSYGGGRMFVSLSMPFGNGTVVRIDKNTTDWRVNLGGELASATRAEATDNSHVAHDRSRYGFTLSAGRAEYSYFPGADNTKQAESHWSISGTMRGIWVHKRQYELWAPQVALTYDRSWAATPAVGIITQGSTEAPPLVMRTVSIAPPGTSPALTLRVSCPYQPLSDVPILIGPSLSHAFTGGDRALSPFGGDSGRLEGELWFYYFPSFTPRADAKTTRIGVAPFASRRTYGDDGQDRFAYGALVELRVNSEIFDY